MITRRDVLKLGLVAGGVGAFATTTTRAQNTDLLKCLCPPDGFPDQLAKPSPAAQPFAAALYVPPVMQPLPALTPAPDPHSHQRYADFLPKKFYEIHKREFLWQYHPQPPYDKGSRSWGFWGKNTANLQQPMTPGPTYHARYGEPVLVRRVNGLPPVGPARWALPCRRPPAICIMATPLPKAMATHKTGSIPANSGTTTTAIFPLATIPARSSARCGTTIIV